MLNFEHFWKCTPDDLKCTPPGGGQPPFQISEYATEKSKNNGRSENYPPKKKNKKIKKNKTKLWWNTVTLIQSR